MKGRLHLIIKPRDNDTYVLQLESLNRRTPANHPKKNHIQQLARNHRTGYNGEQSLDFVLSFLPENKFNILHNLRIEDEYGAFQIDTLLLSCYFSLIIEVKNVYGTITFDELGQTIRTQDDGTQQGFNNPIEQVSLQRFRLHRWLELHQFPQLPIENLVVYSNPYTILKNVTKCEKVTNSVLHKEGLISKIERFSQLYQTASLSKRELKGISTALCDAHTIEKINVLEKYGVKENELLCGVICPACGGGR